METGDVVLTPDQVAHRSRRPVWCPFARLATCRLPFWSATEAGRLVLVEHHLMRDHGPLALLEWENARAMRAPRTTNPEEDQT